MGFNYFFGDSPGARNKNQPIALLDRWEKTGDKKNLQRFNTYVVNSLSEYLVKAKASDMAYSDASYVRLKNLSISWQLPQSWKNAAKFKDAHLYVQGQNLFTWTKYPGLDPENKSTTSLPPLRIITIGLNVTL